MDKDGGILYEGKYPNTRAAAAELAKTILSRYDSRAVCETTGWLWLKTYETLEDHKIPIVLANTLRLRRSQSGAKTDKLDAKNLASRLRMKDIQTCHVPSSEKRRNLALLCQRITLVQERTRVLNCQHAICDKYDYRAISGHGNTSGPKYQAFLNSLKLDPGDTGIMAQLVRHVKYLNGEIGILDDLPREAAGESEDTRLIMSLPLRPPLVAKKQ